jgi:pyruvate formate lyase activating enzyme
MVQDGGASANYPGKGRGALLMTVAGVAGETAGTVFNVQRASFHDGPGIRTTVFLKGCPLRCPWCHNPEGVAAAPEVLVSETRCLRCGSCVAECPRPGGPLPAGSALGSAGCTACARCVEACPSGAREIAGRTWKVGELLGEVLRDRLTYEESGGGVTFSGGEPLAQAEFLMGCLDACREAGLHTAVDTCGFAAPAMVAEVAQRADLLLWDIKVLDPNRHLALTGAPLQPILENLAVAARTGVPIWLRIPVIPGLNDDDGTMRAAAHLATLTAAVRKVSLLPYHRTADGKRARLGRENPLAGTATPTEGRMRALASWFEGTGIETTIGG